MPSNQANESLIDFETISSKEIIKTSMKYMIYRFGPLTAKNFQEKLNLKRQRTYEYLKELVSDEELNITYKPHPDRPNIKIAYYSIPDVKYDPNCTAEIYKEICIRRINYAIAGFLEAKAAINKMSSDEFAVYDDFDNKNAKFYGATPGVHFLTDDEYVDYYQGFFNLMKEIRKKNKKRNEDIPKDERIIHEGNLMIFGFFKNYPFFR